MPRDPRIIELLLRYKEMQERGRSVSPEHLCRDAPELLDEVRRGVADLEAAQHQIALPATVGEPCTVPSDVPTLSDLPARAGRYEIEGEIARGGMGAVLRARDPELNRTLAIKVLRLGYGGWPDLERRFREEAQVTGQLQHPGIPPVHEVGTLADGRPFFAMKLIKGQTLAGLLRKRGAPGAELPRFLGIFEQVCQAVAYAHSKGVIHRDLKPLNVMVGAFGEVQVMDWGLAKVLHGGPPAAESGQAASVIATVRTASPGLSSQDGAVLGTYAYMAPEQARGEVDRLDERADVFGLGAMLCEILTGQPPYGGPAVAVLAVMAELGPALERLAACGADAELLGLARRCLAAAPVERPRDAGDVAAAVAAYQAAVQERLRQAELERAAAQARAEEEAKTRRVAEGKAAAERRSRRLTVGLAAAALLAAGAIGGGTWLVYVKHQEKSAVEERRRQEARAQMALQMNEARLLRAQAQEHPLGDPERFRAAQAAAERAVKLAGASEAGEELRPEAEALAGELRAETAAAEKDRELLRALLDVRAPWEGPNFVKDDKGVMMALAQPSADEQFAAAFRAWDPALDLDALPTREAAARLGGRPQAVRDEVVAALDEWAAERWRTTPRGDWQHVAALVAALDRGPGAERRVELRGLLTGGTLLPERLMGILAMALRPVPVPFDAGPGAGHARLRRLAAEADVAGGPVLGLLALARVLDDVNQGTEAERLLRAAARARPGEVALHAALGRLLGARGRWAEAVECWSAARALRPGLGGALAEALVSAGRVGEGMALYDWLLAERPDNPWLHLGRGVALTGQGRLKEAEAAWREVIRHNYESARIHVNLAHALHGQDRFEEAEAACREAIRLKPDLPDAHSRLGNALRFQNRFKEAEIAYREAIRLKSSPWAYNGLGALLCTDLHDYEKAEEAFREAIRLQPDNQQALVNLARALDGQDRFKEAESACREATRLQPGNPDALVSLALALCGQDRFKEAEAACREAIRLNPDDHVAHSTLGYVVNRQGRSKEAEAACREAIRLKPNKAEAHCNLALALLRQDRPTEAEAAYREAIRLKFDLPEARVGLGAVLCDHLGRPKEAEEAFREAIRLKPNCAEAHSDLGVALKRQGRYAEAEAAYREAIRLNPKYPAARVGLGSLLCDHLGRPKEAEAAFREAIRLQPDHHMAHYDLGEALRNQGRYQEAETAYREAIRLKPEFVWAHNGLGTLLCDHLGRPKEAEAAFLAAIRLQPDLPEVHCNLGLALKSQGRFTQALESLRRGHALGSKRGSWPNSSGEWVRGCERLVELDRKLLAMMRGDAEGASAAERLELSDFCRHPAKRLHTAAARLAADAFAADPKLAADLQQQHCYNAACSAALAAAGQGQDAQHLPDKVQRTLRRQTLAWLRDDLSQYAKLAERDDAKGRQFARQNLERWQQDADFASIRDPVALARLPEDEGLQWRSLWQDVAALLQKVTEKK